MTREATGVPPLNRDAYTVGDYRDLADAALNLYYRDRGIAYTSDVSGIDARYLKNRVYRRNMHLSEAGKKYVKSTMKNPHDAYIQKQVDAEKMKRVKEPILLSEIERLALYKAWGNYPPRELHESCPLNTKR